MQENGLASHCGTKVDVMVPTGCLEMDVMIPTGFLEVDVMMPIGCLEMDVMMPTGCLEMRATRSARTVWVVVLFIT